MRNHHYACVICGDVTENSGKAKEGLSCHGATKKSHELTKMLHLGGGKKGRQRSQQFAADYVTHERLFHKPEHKPQGKAE